MAHARTRDDQVRTEQNALIQKAGLRSLPCSTGSIADIQIENTGVENMRTPKSLHTELKRDLLKLNTVLKLPDNVLFLANEFLEYLLNNHLVVREPRSILHAFNIALCWRAASFLKSTELNRRESLALASDGLNYECNEAPL
ncbi:Helicase protein MOM1 [Zea mays]|uniref:Helicase protein MOM1 n=1 Tax=Zea mays TaxID=4577 RepID=A0A3L6E1S2_MAIZE|nr:Helicase protein MOM1 [Zea mays]PWZ33078.1 Helicase protein MOM1 [Zea mays]